MYTGFLRVIYSTPHGSVILVSLETRLVSYETRLVSRETRGGKLRVSGTVVSLRQHVCEINSNLSEKDMTLS